MRRNNCWLAVLAFSTALPILRHGSARERVLVVDARQVDHNETPHPAKQSPSGFEAVDETGVIFPEKTVSHPSRRNEPDPLVNNNHPDNKVANGNPDLAWHTSEHTNLPDHVRGNDDPFENVRNPDAGFKENSPSSDEVRAPKDRAERTNRSLARINDTQEPGRASQVSEELRLSPLIHRDTVNVSPGTTGAVIRRDQGIYRRAASRKRGVDWGKDRRGLRGSLVQPGNQYYGHVGRSSRDDDSVTSSQGDAERKAVFVDRGDETSGRVVGDIPGGIDVGLVGSSDVKALFSGAWTVNDDGRFGGDVEMAGEVFQMAEREMGEVDIRGVVHTTDEESKKMVDVDPHGLYDFESRKGGADIFKKLDVDEYSPEVLKSRMEADVFKASTETLDIDKHADEHRKLKKNLDIDDRHGSNFLTPVKKEVAEPKKPKRRMHMHKQGSNILGSSKQAATFKNFEKTVNQQEQYLGSLRSIAAEAVKTSDEELNENDHQQFTNIQRLTEKEGQLQFLDPKSPTKGNIQLFKEPSKIDLEERLQLLDFMKPAKEEPKAFRPPQKEIDERLESSETLMNLKKELKFADPELSSWRTGVGQKTSMYSLMAVKRRYRRSTESSSEQIRSSSSGPHKAGIKSSESPSPFEPAWNRSPTGMENEELAPEEEVAVPTSCKSAGAVAERVYVPGDSAQQRSTVNSEDNGGGAPCSRNQDIFRVQKSTGVVESPTIVGIRSTQDPAPTNRKSKTLGISDTVGNGFDDLGDGVASSNEFLVSFATTTGTRSNLADTTASVKDPWIGNSTLIAPIADRVYRSDTSNGANEDLRAAEKVAEGDGDSDPDDGKDCEDKNAKLSGPNDRDKGNRLLRTDRSNYSANEDCGDRGIEGCSRREGYVEDGVLDDLKLNGQDVGDRDKVDRYAESYDTDEVLEDGGNHESFRENYVSGRVDRRGFDGQRGGEQGEQTASNGAVVYSMIKRDDVGVTAVDYGSSRKDNGQLSVQSDNEEDEQGASNNESVYSTSRNEEMGVEAEILNYEKKREDNGQLSGQSDNDKNNRGTLNDGSVYSMNCDKKGDVKAEKLEYSSSRKDNDFSGQGNQGKDNPGTFGSIKDGFAHSMSHDKEKGSGEEELHNGSSHKENSDISGQMNDRKDNRGISKDGGMYSISHKKKEDVIGEELLNGKNYRGNVRLSEQSDSNKTNRVTSNKVVKPEKLSHENNRKDNDYFSGSSNIHKDNQKILNEGFVYSPNGSKEKRTTVEDLYYGSNLKINGHFSRQSNTDEDNHATPNDESAYLINHTKSGKLDHKINHKDNSHFIEESNIDNPGTSNDELSAYSMTQDVVSKKLNFSSSHEDEEHPIAQNKDNQTISIDEPVYSINNNKDKRVEPNKLDYGSNSENNAQLNNKSDTTKDNLTIPNNKPPHPTIPTKQQNTKYNKLDYRITHASDIEPNNTKPSQTPPNADPLHAENPNIKPVIAAKRISTKDSLRSDNPVEEARAHPIVSYNEKLIDRLSDKPADNRDRVTSGVLEPSTNNRNNDETDEWRSRGVHRDMTAIKAFSTTSSMNGPTSKNMTKESGNAPTDSERGSPVVGRNSAYLANDMNTPIAERASNVVENDGKSAEDRSGRQRKAAGGRPRNSRLETGPREPTVIGYVENEKKGANVVSISLATYFDDINERTIVSEGLKDSMNRNNGRDDEPNGSEDINPRGLEKQSADLMEDQLRPRKERRSSVRNGNPDTGDFHPGTGSNSSDVAPNVTSLKIDSGGSSVPGPISLVRPPGFIGEDRSMPSESYESVSTFSEVSWTDQDLEVSSLTTDDLERSLEIDSTVGSLENDDYSRLDDELAGSENASVHDQERRNLWPVKHSAVVEGDLVLGGLMMVHEREDTVTCGPVMPQGGVQALEAMLYTLDWLNEQEIVPGVKIGAHILDDCDKDTYGLEMAVDFIKGSISNIDGAEYHCNKTAVRKVISGVVGAASSVTSIQVANLLRLFRIPQVSFFSTSPELSNKQRFEYFSRTIPSDHYQVKAMVDIVKQMNWSFVSIIYEESNYGIKAFEVLEDLLEKYNICIAIKEKLVKDSGVARDTAYDDIVLKLLTKPRAKGCIIFGSDQEVAGVMRAVRRCNATGTFSWIGSDGWSARRLVSYGNEPEVEGTLSVQPQANPVRGFEEYFLNLTVENNRRNPWFVEFWEDHFECRYPNASRTPYNQKYIKNCTTKERLTKNDTVFEDQLQFVSDAVMAFAYAFKDMHKELCHGKPGLCDAMKPTKGTELLKYLQKVDFEGLSGDKFKFDKNGDGPARYNIIHFKQTEPGKYEWVRVGEYLEGELQLNRSEIQFKLGHPLPPESVCSLPCEVGQSKTYAEGEKCCWHCINCSQDEIRHPDDETRCIECRQGTLPDETHSTCREIPEEFLRPESGWAIGAMSFSATGILITFFVCGVFLKHNDTPVVRASGRELSYVLLCGILLCYLVTFALVMKPTNIVCGIQRFAAGFCFTVVYAALLTKTNRISRIFNASKHSAKRPSFISPRSQLIICSGLVFVQILINGVWSIIDPARAMHHYPNKEDNLLVCNSYVDASYMIAFAYPIMLIVVCTVYAVLTRKIPEAFNESKHIGFTMYTTCVIWLAFVPLYFGTDNNVALRITSMSVTISLSASVTIACLFTPKLYIILIRPERNVRQSMMPPRYSTTKSSAMTATNVSSMIAPATLTGATCDQNKGVKKHIISTIDCWTQSEYYELEVKDQKNGKPAPTVISRLTQTSSNDLEQTGIVGNKDAKENPTSTTTATVTTTAMTTTIMTKENTNTTKQINNNARIGNGPVNQPDISL